MSQKSKKEYSAEEIAKYFIWKAQKENKVLTNKKLQKLLYYAQAWNLVFTNERLFSEDIEAWVHGPTVRKIYGKYKKFGYEKIEETVKRNDIKITDKYLKLLEEIWRIYGKYDADYLEELTHCEEPWQKAREGLFYYESSSNVINDDDMKSYYSKRLTEAKDKSKT